jgi:hypothetical protein
MSIGPEETLIEGAWVLQEGRMIADTAEERIRALIGSELRRLATSLDGWEVLYRDPGDGRYWELTFPNGEMHGGGPQLLRLLNAGEARTKYGSMVP